MLNVVRRHTSGPGLCVVHWRKKERLQVSFGILLTAWASGMIAGQVISS